MRRALVSCIGVITLSAATLPAAATTVDEVIARHIAAKGGDKWDEIRTMRITGDFTAFSKVGPFTLIRARDKRYRIDHTMNERRVIVGYDGEQPWWDNEWMEAGPQPISDPVELAALERELDFTTPLFDYEERGFTVKLVEERNEIDGFPAIAIELVRDDESVETWFLDPDTHLELARESPGSDFGVPQPSLTFFDDFHEIGGVMIPHYVETQFYARDRMMRVRDVELNVDLDDQAFSMPVATGMESFQSMLGDWTVKVESKQSPRQPEFAESSRESVITASLNGGLIEERFSTQGAQAVRTLSYDRHREHYVMTQMNDTETYLDIQVGPLVNGALTVSNVETGTTSMNFRFTLHERSTISGLSKDGFTIQRENSFDGGQNWAVMQKLTYTRKDG